VPQKAQASSYTVQDSSRTASGAVGPRALCETFCLLSLAASAFVDMYVAARSFGVNCHCSRLKTM
jgi:hypothetical protein